jgi:hypothetical protein
MLHRAIMSRLMPPPFGRAAKRDQCRNLLDIDETAFWDFGKHEVDVLPRHLRESAVVRRQG